MAGKSKREKGIEKGQRMLLHRLLDGIDAGDTSIMDEVFHEDAVMEWPASREQVVGAQARRDVYAHMPVLPRVSDRHIWGEGDTWVVEATLTYGDKPFAAVLAFQFKDGKIIKEVGYWAEPFEAPEWRAEWVRPLDLAARS
jgi:ketosteroid isomerase-like protein